MKERMRVLLHTCPSSVVCVALKGVKGECLGDPCEGEMALESQVPCRHSSVGLLFSDWWVGQVGQVCILLLLS